MKLKAYKVQLACSCCDATVYFSSDEAIEAAFARAGLSSVATIVDEAGQVVEEVDTFYGWRRTGEPRRGLEYLWERAFGRPDDEETGG